jgi:putative restriction endonuclease
VPDPDLPVRLTAFKFLDAQRQLHPDGLPRATLQQGFAFNGDRVPLLGPQGIFKPRVCELPISITTVPITEGETRPYDDTFGEDGLLRYRYRGTDPGHWENVGLRTAMQRQTPLIYFHGIVPGRYEAAYPISSVDS